MGRRWKPLARQAIEYILVEVLELIATRGSRGNGMERETRLELATFSLEGMCSELNSDSGWGAV